MQPVHAISIAEHGSEKNRIGPNERSKGSASAARLEKLIVGSSPLPMSFDVAPTHDNYFTEFTYFDMAGSLVLQTMSPEVTARLVEGAVQTCGDWRSELELFKESFHDKYKLKPAAAQYKSVAFLPGGNLLKAIDRSVLDRALYQDPDLVLKPHPITAPDALRWFGVSFGYDRIVEPSESGIDLLMSADRVYSTAASELGIFAAALRKEVIDMSCVRAQPTLTYAPVYRLFGSVDNNEEVVGKFVASDSSGFLAHWRANTIVRAQNYFNSAMALRNFFKPSYSALMFKHVNVQQVKEAQSALRKD